MSAMRFGLSRRARRLVYWVYRSTELSNDAFALGRPSLYDGIVHLKLTLVDADEEHGPLAERELEVDFPQRGAIIDVYAYLQDIEFPWPGEFRLQLFGLGEFIMERRVFVRQEVS
jgi:hypothetical protein